LEDGVADTELPIFNYAHPGWLTGLREYSPAGIAGEYRPLSSADKAALDPKDQPISVRLGRFKLVRNPDEAALDGSQPRRTVLVDLETDPSEQADAGGDHPEVTRTLETLLDRWFEGVRKAPAAFAHPVHEVGPRGAAWAANTPARVLGRVTNTVTGVSGWSTTGDGVAYALRVAEPGRYRVEMTWKGPVPRGIEVRWGSATVRLNPTTDGLAISDPLEMGASAADLECRWGSATTGPAGDLLSVRLVRTEPTAAEQRSGPPP
jgi:hypothetical protein